MGISIYMQTDAHDSVSTNDAILTRVLALTDQAWQALAAGRPFEFQRVEMGFEALLASVANLELDHSTESDPVIANILRVLASSNMIAKRYDHRHAFELLVQAVGPITDKAKCLDTAPRQL